ncbi:MAG: Hpt domain-containing protein [Pseudomonadota bacterium]|nr:Hpt domain-containing protein [Pseudomonadota bacterium]
MRGLLDDGAIRRLRELDPTGESHLLMRVFNAFETSLNRLLPQLIQALDAADAPGVRLVAHTLKSSSATVGALELSRLCAEVEVQARQLQLDRAVGGMEQMLLEAEAVRESLRCLAGTSDTTAGAA